MCVCVCVSGFKKLSRLNDTGVSKMIWGLSRLNDTGCVKDDLGFK